jgi:hypothetical protein
VHNARRKQQRAGEKIKISFSRRRLRRAEDNLDRSGAGRLHLRGINISQCLESWCEGSGRVGGAVSVWRKKVPWDYASDSPSRLRFCFYVF